MTEVARHRAVPEPAEIVEKAAAFVPVLAERAREAERTRRVPDETIAELRDAGLFRLLQPRGEGGWGLGIQAFSDVTRTLAQGCASTAWVYGFLLVHANMLQSLPAEGRTEVFGPGGFAFVTTSSGFQATPSGQAVPADGGWRLTGRWPYASASRNADWALVLSVEASEQGSRPLGLVVPIAEFTVEDVWYYSGMAATGSNDLVADDVFVPASRRWNPPQPLGTEPWPWHGTRAEPPQDAPLLGFSPLKTFGILQPAVAVGAAEAALDLFRQRVSTRVVAFGQGPQRGHREAWARFARAASTVRVARLLLDDQVRIVEQVTENGTVLSANDAALLRVGSAHAAELARDAVAVIMDGAGSSVHHLDHPLQRIQRDIDTLKSHSYLNWDGAATAAGSALLGHRPLDPLLTT
jgi:alkylation response protein AidB-like acyl-CoA dehydrogenase